MVMKKCQWLLKNIFLNKKHRKKCGVF